MRLKLTTQFSRPNVVRLSSPDHFLILICLLLAPFQVDGQSSEAENSHQAQINLDVGLQHYEDREFAQALTKLEKAKALAPQSPMPLVGLGLVHKAQERLGLAITCFQLALSLDPNLIIVRQELGQLYTRQRKFDLAVQQYQRAIALDPNHSLTHIRLGTVMATQGRYSSAIKQFEQAIKIEPDNPASYYYLGEVFGWLNDLPKAILAFETAIQLAPNQVESHYQLGVVLMRQRSYQSAILALETAAKLGPFHKSTHFNLARAYTRVGQQAKAQKTTQRFEALHQMDEQAKPFLRRLEVDPSDLNARYQMANVYYKHGWFEAAVSHYQQILASKPDSTSVILALVQLRTEQKKYPTALNWAKRLTRIQPNLSSGYVYVGLLSAELDLVAEAIQAYERAIDLEPDSATAYNNLAWLYAQRNIELDQAVDLCLSALRLSTKPTYLDTLAQLYCLQGQHKLALQQIEKALVMEPGNQNFQNRLKSIEDTIKRDAISAQD